MSTDARNPLIAWGSVLAFLGIGWLTLYFDLIPDMPDWVLPAAAILSLLAFGVDILRTWRRARTDG